MLLTLYLVNQKGTGVEGRVGRVGERSVQGSMALALCTMAATPL